MGRVNIERSEPEQPEPAAPGGSAAGDSSGAGDSGSTGKSPRPRRLLVLLFGVAALLLAADVLTKVAAVAALEDQPPARLFGGAVYLVLVRNPGAAFSLATGMTWLLALLAIVVVGVILWLAPKLRSTGWAIGLGLVLGGACGNLVDRLFREPGFLRGHVVDFVSLFAPDGSVWPVFNVADSAIVCGGVLVVLMSLLGRDYDGTVHRKKERS
ncbi:signal peptidase II [Saccharopolyspora sp. HNM0986]|nr:signal peptidase II [Saccharopolyspora sp. HNM0986]MBK0867301.1 signal peptidase II [Saccharopolyspora sp. HNM0986]